MIKIALWGTGKIAKQLIEVIEDEIVLVVDNDSSKWGTIWNGFVISRPDEIQKCIGDFEKIIIATACWREIRKQIVEEYLIEEQKIDNMYYRQREKFLNGLEEKNRGHEAEKQKYFDYIKQNPLGVFNDEFVKQYDKIEEEVMFDDEKSLYFVFHHGRKMYFSRNFQSSQMVKQYYRSLLLEQDEHSPHRYLTEIFGVRKGDIVLDGGVAEGNFALEVVDLVEKIYLVEADSAWVEVLKYTFEPYKDKVEIIEGFLGSGAGEISIDEIIEGGKLDFVKLDIEGAEVSALQGAKRTLMDNCARLDICAYHNEKDEESIKQILEDYEYKCDVSQGYMVFITTECLKKEVECPKLVRGLVRGYRQDTK